MKKEVSNTKFFLRVFELVSKKGTIHNGCREFNGVKAWHDFDGYTCWLAYKDLTVTLLFHGGLSIDFDSHATLNEFRQKFDILSEIKSAG